MAEDPEEPSTECVTAYPLSTRYLDDQMIAILHRAPSLHIDVVTHDQMTAILLWDPSSWVWSLNWLNNLEISDEQETLCMQGMSVDHLDQDLSQAGQCALYCL